MRRFSVTLSFVPKHSSNRIVRQNRCVLFDSFTYIYTALLPEKVDSAPTFIYIYIYIYKYIYIYIYIYIYSNYKFKLELMNSTSWRVR